MRHGLLITKIMLTYCQTDTLHETPCDIMRTHVIYIIVLAQSLYYFIEIFFEIEFVAQRPLAYCNLPCSTFSFAER